MRCAGVAELSAGQPAPRHAVATLVRPTTVPAGTGAVDRAVAISRARRALLFRPRQSAGPDAPGRDPASGRVRNDADSGQGAGACGPVGCRLLLMRRRNELRRTVLVRVTRVACHLCSVRAECSYSRRKSASRSVANPGVEMGITARLSTSVGGVLGGDLRRGRRRGRSGRVGCARGRRRRDSGSWVAQRLHTLPPDADPAWVDGDTHLLPDDLDVDDASLAGLPDPGVAEFAAHFADREGPVVGLDREDHGREGRRRWSPRYMGAVCVVACLLARPRPSAAVSTLPTG